MFRFVGIASEHTRIPNKLLEKSEMTTRTLRSSYARDDDLTPYNEYSFDCYCTYAWIETDEIDVSNEYDNRIPITVMDYKPKYSKRTQFVFEEPIWNWIEELRTNEEQKWIERNIDKLNNMFIDFAHIN